MAKFEQISVRAYVRGGENCHSFDDINLIEEFSRIDVEKLFVSNRRNRNKFVNKQMNKLKNLKSWFVDTNIEKLKDEYSWEYGWYGHLTWLASETIECLIDLNCNNEELIKYIEFFEPYEKLFMID
jgi:hypothetical protein